ncbi:hypothetical protein F5Y07DRAFT_243371 [Xylaria sp. FL0933]|nr:hypothetical protein F5Y07DRAFT_243371 [Xylaria sp. FL0933]
MHTANYSVFHPSARAGENIDEPSSLLNTTSLLRLERRHQFLPSAMRKSFSRHFSWKKDRLLVLGHGDQSNDDLGSSGISRSETAIVNNPKAHNFLKPLHDPEDAVIDIVAVHGLNPTNADFHAEKTWTAPNGKLWLRDFLPESLPRARILLFGYNANIAFETSTAGVREQAENLLNYLFFHRRNCEGRPIIFVCHSLGGLVVKRALVTSKQTNKYSDIKNATYDTDFFHS